MPFKFSTKQILPLVLLMLLFATTIFGQTSGSLSGIIQDSQGNAVVSAKVTISEPAKGLQIDTTTSGEGTFTFPTLQPGTYTVTIEAPGFKKYVKTGIVINTADKQSTGRIALEVGAVESTVEVIADTTQLQIKTESGEQSNIITNQQVQNLALNGRNYLDLVKLTPGVVSTADTKVAGPGGFSNFSIAGTRQNQHNLTIDGTTNVDTGSNGTQHIALALDNISEFKVLTSNYQAEYGRSAGGDIKVVTKGGTSQFHGTGYYFHRHEGLNANTFFRNADPPPTGFTEPQRALFRYNYQGYNIGGPIYLPKKIFGPLGMEKTKERLFFFWSQEWQEQLIPPDFTRQLRVPTAREVTGDFSQTRDANGQLITIIDPVTKAPFPGNIIPSARFSQSGQAILKLFNRAENVTGGSLPYNHSSSSSIGYPRRENSIRVDYNLSEKTRMFVRYTRDSDQQIQPYGNGWTSGQNFPLTPTIFKQAPAFNGTLNVTTTLSPTLTNEFVFGGSQNNLTLNPQDPTAGTLSGIGLTFKPPYTYPSSQFVNIEFRTVTGYANSTNVNASTPLGLPGINAYDRFPYKNSNTTFDFYDNVSKVIGTHTTKAGIYIQRSRKDQAAGNSLRIIFNNNAANPNNTGHPFANALMGNFDTYQQPTSGIYQGQYRSTNVEWYLQDNWKVTKRLTLDYGLRFNWIQPQYDQRNQDAYFVPSAYDFSKAVRLYRRDPSGATTNAVDPANPSAVIPNSAFLVGRIVPGSGDPFNGIKTVKDGYLRGGLNNRGIQYGPAFGFAYDVFGNAKTVVRGGYRIGYDRVSGNDLIFPAVEQPPLFVNPIFNFGNLDTVGANTGQVALAPVNVIGGDPAGHIPNVQSFSLQVQHEIGFNTVLSVAYVGTLSRHLQELLNINYIPYGTLFTRAAQNPALFPGGIVPTEDTSIADVYKNAGLKFDGSKALTAEFLRRYPGYGDIFYRVFGGSANYHSMQVTLQRRFNRSLSYGMSYTWAKAMGTSNDGTTTPGIDPVCSRCVDYRRLAFDRTHYLTINYIYNLPQFSRKLNDNKFAKAIFDGWEISGITQFISGQPEDVGFSLQSGANIQQRIGGSWTQPVRILTTKDPQPSTSREAFYDITAFRMPTPGSVTGSFPRNFVNRPGINVTDLSVFKNFSLGGEGKRTLQFRLEAFNVFNHANFNDFNRALVFDIASNFSDFTAKQQGSTTSLRNLRNSAVGPATGRLGRATGEVSTQPGFVSPNRVLQLGVKIFF